MAWGFTRHVVRPHPKAGDLLRVGADGTAHTINSRTGKSVPVAKVAEVLDGANVANVALGAANLVVGLYTAYQTKKTREEINAGLVQVRTALQMQAQKLDLILAAHAQTDQKLDALMMQVEAGFERLEDAVQAVVVERRADELRNAMVAFFHAQEAVAGEIAAEAPLDDELSALLRGCGDLRTRAESQLMVETLPREARQPLVMMSTAAAAAEVDCLLLRDDSDATREKAQRRLARIEERLKAEVENLHDGASAWDVVRFIAPQTSSYRVAGTVLQSRRKALAGEDSGDIEVVTAGLLAPSVEISDEAAETTVELRTLGDYEWYIDAFGEDRETFEVRSVLQVRRRALEGLLGASSTPLGLGALKELCRPGVWSAYSEWVSEWLGKSIEVKLQTEEGDVVGAAVDTPSGADDVLVAGKSFTFKGPRRVWYAGLGGKRGQPRVTHLDLQGPQSSKSRSISVRLQPAGEAEASEHGPVEQRFAVPRNERFDEDGLVRALRVAFHRDGRLTVRFEYLNRKMTSAYLATWT